MSRLEVDEGSTSDNGDDSATVIIEYAGFSGGCAVREPLLLQFGEDLKECQTWRSARVASSKG